MNVVLFLVLTLLRYLIIPFSLTLRFHPVRSRQVLALLTDAKIRLLGKVSDLSSNATLFLITTIQENTETQKYGVMKQPENALEIKPLGNRAKRDGKHRSVFNAFIPYEI